MALSQLPRPLGPCAQGPRQLRGRLGCGDQPQSSLSSNQMLAWFFTPLCPARGVVPGDRDQLEPDIPAPAPALG